MRAAEPAKSWDYLINFHFFRADTGGHAPKPPPPQVAPLGDNKYPTTTTYVRNSEKLCVKNVIKIILAERKFLIFAFILSIFWPNFGYNSKNFCLRRHRHRSFTIFLQNVFEKIFSQIVVRFLSNSRLLTLTTNIINQIW